MSRYTVSVNHEYFMHRCIDLASHGRGNVGDGALVGAVLVRDGQVRAEGWHQAYGGPHAERELLNNFDQKISSNYIMYVSLETCCHHGKTPPCTRQIIERGLKTVVYGMLDPDPRVAGKGILELKASGVNVIGPVLSSCCKRFNRGYISVRTKHRPFIMLHIAQTASADIANPNGSPVKITSNVQDRWTHEFLRARCDAVLAGVGTIIADDPILNIRFVQSNSHVYRLILDPNFRIPINAKVVTGDLARDTILIVNQGSLGSLQNPPPHYSGFRQIAQQDSMMNKSRKAEILKKRGVRIFEVLMKDGFINFEDLWRKLLTPSQEYHGLTSILVEGGPRTWKAFRDAGLVDEEVTLVGSNNR